MSLLPVAEAVRRLLADAAPLPSQRVPLAQAAGRVLAEDLAALRTQPPFSASAMDGYAVRAADAAVGARLRLVGASRAGERFAGRLGEGEAVRIFTGAPVPEGADAIVIQEDADRDGDEVLVREVVAAGRYIRPPGLDFRKGDTLLEAGRELDPRALSLAAAMGYFELPVRRRPVVALLANGDELVPPGAQPGPDQIVSSNTVGLAALVERTGGEARDLGIAPDRSEAIAAHVDKAAGADVLVVIGGASVGEHDLVRAALAARGMALDFWRIAMRPGKPLMVGRIDDLRVLGLPGNPVSALVCGYVFLRPLIRKMLGLDPNARLVRARLGAPMAVNDQREDYVRGDLREQGGELVATPCQVQDSSMLATLARANSLIVRPPHAPPAEAGDHVAALPLDG
jgi:molybdopterin molybdotransferase